MRFAYVLTFLLSISIAQTSKLKCKRQCSYRCNHMYQSCLNDATMFCENDSYCIRKERNWCVNLFCPAVCVKRCTRIKPKTDVKIGNCKRYTMKCTCKRSSKQMYKECMKKRMVKCLMKHTFKLQLKCERRIHSICLIPLEKKRLCFCAYCILSNLHGNYAGGTRTTTISLYTSTTAKPQHQLDVQEYGEKLEEVAVQSKETSAPNTNVKRSKWSKSLIGGVTGAICVGLGILIAIGIAIHWKRAKARYQEEFKERRKEQLISQYQ